MTSASKVSNCRWRMTSGTPAEPITHSTRFVLVDKQGQIRGYYSGTEEAELNRLAADARKSPVIGISDLATVNAGLNATAAASDRYGLLFHQTKKHSRAQSVHGRGGCRLGAVSHFVFDLSLQRRLRAVYEAGLDPGCLFSSTADAHGLAAVALPMVLRTVFLAAKGRFGNHVRAAKWTFPVWMYVSVTGVVVYLLLYHCSEA